MVADTRVLKGYSASDLAKMLILDNGVVIGASGSKFIMDDFIPLIGREAAHKDFTSFVQRVEDIVGDLYKRYQPRLNYRWEGFTALVMGLDQLTRGEPRIRAVYEQGWSEEIEGFEVIGHGADFALPFVKMLYQEKASLREMWTCSYYAISIIEKLDLDVTVGGLPDIAVVKSGSKPRFVKGWKEIGGMIDAFHNEWKDRTAEWLRHIVFYDDTLWYMLNHDDPKTINTWAKEQKARNKKSKADQRRQEQIRKEDRVRLQSIDEVLKDHPELAAKIQEYSSGRAKDSSQ